MTKSGFKNLTCKECNNQFTIEFEFSQSGFASCNKKYCSKECKEAKSNRKEVSSEKLNCLFCKREYTLPPSLSKQSKFCSRLCQNRHYGSLKVKERINKECIVCGVKYETFFDSKRKFCSKKCSGISGRTSRVVVACEICGNNFEKYSTSVKRFCKRLCQYQAQSNGKIKIFSRGRSGFRTDLNCYFRSALEADFARFCNFTGIKFEYEPKTFNPIVNGKTVSYTPDFFLCEQSEFVELKAGRDDHAFEDNLQALKVLQSEGLNIKVIYMKDFYKSLLEKNLYNEIPNLEKRDYKRSKSLVVQRD